MFNKFFAMVDKLGLTKQSCEKETVKYFQFANRRMVFVDGDYIGTYRFWKLSDLFAA